MSGNFEFDHAAMSRERYRNMITQQELAEAAGLTVSTVNRLENGMQQPRISTVRKIAEVLGVGPLDLVKDQSKFDREEVG